MTTEQALAELLNALNSGDRNRINAARDSGREALDGAKSALRELLDGPIFHGISEDMQKHYPQIAAARSLA
jgi:hypothetical protein